MSVMLSGVKERAEICLVSLVIVTDRVELSVGWNKANLVFIDFECLTV